MDRFGDAGLEHRHKILINGHPLRLIPLILAHRLLNPSNDQPLQILFMEMRLELFFDVLDDLLS